MENKKLIEDIVLGNQFEKTQADKESALLDIIKQQLMSNTVNENIKSLYQKSGIDISKITSLGEIPFIPVTMFK